MDDGFDAIVTITNRLGSDICIVPTHMNITTERFAVQFFDLWYCENRLPLDIVSGCDKIFVSKFWKALAKLTGIKLKMSSLYHPESNSCSERSNKSVVQSLWFHIQRNQLGWVKALPLIQFNLMNTINISMGFTPFQLCMGCSPQLIPPLVTDTTPIVNQDKLAMNLLIEQITLDVAKAWDNLLSTKISRSEFANRHRSDEVNYSVGNKVMLSTEHRWRKYMQKHSGHVMKFMPHFDSPFVTTRTHPSKSAYTLDLPNELDCFLTLHASQLRKFVSNNDDLFPLQKLPQLGPVVTEDRCEEWLIDRI
jgi:hypothetical protein